MVTRGKLESSFIPPIICPLIENIASDKLTFDIFMSLLTLL